jgi:hypothetical protein
LEESELGNRLSVAAEKKVGVLTEHLQNEENKMDGGRSG